MSDRDSPSEVDPEAPDPEAHSEVDPESVAPPPQPGELIASVLSMGPVPWFIKRRRNLISSIDPNASRCVCGPHCRCCGKRTEFKHVQTEVDKERIKAERRERRAQMEQKEKNTIENEEKLLRWLKAYFYLGCFGLPLVHFMAVLYFIPELRNAHNSNFRIRQYCYMALIVGIIESLLWVVWFTVFQIIHDGENAKWMQALNILNHNSTIPSLV